MMDREMTGPEGGVRGVAGHSAATASQEQHVARVEVRSRREAMVWVLRRHAEVLQPQDRRLIEAVYVRRASCREIAAELGRNESTIRRRLNRLIKTVASVRFRYTLLHRHEWPDHEPEIARQCVLQGRPIREVAASLQLSECMVRRVRDRVLARAAAVERLLSQLKSARRGR